MLMRGYMFIFGIFPHTGGIQDEDRCGAGANARKGTRGQWKVGDRGTIERL